MDIKYQRPGVMEVFLDEYDADQLRLYGYTMCRNGLYGQLNCKTHVRIDENLERPEAGLDGDADVTVMLPNGGADLPVFIGREALSIFGQDPGGRLDWFFGEAGGVQVSLKREVA